jgi:hypothetical protein
MRPRLLGLKMTWCMRMTQKAEKKLELERTS